MITCTGYTVRHKRIGEFREYVKTLPSFRYLYDPTKYRNGDLHVSFTISGEDDRRLGQLYQRWRQEDIAATRKAEQERSLWHRAKLAFGKVLP